MPHMRNTRLDLVPIHAELRSDSSYNKFLLDGQTNKTSFYVTIFILLFVKNCL